MVKKDPLFILFFSITIILAIFFRTYNYFDRVYIHADHSLFAQGALYSARTFSIPQIGPFAQSTFFTGPWWLWTLSILYLFPFGLLTPWYFISLFSMGFIFLIYVVGREIGDKWLGIIAALLAAVSFAQIDNSFTLWNAAADSSLALVAIYFLIKFYKTKNPLAAFGLSFAVSLATTIHFQMVLAAPLILIVLVTSRPKLKHFLAAFIGFVIPFLPFLIFDLRFNWFWAKSVWIYLTVDQYRFWVPNRWLTYAGVYWPQTWGYILGVSQWLGGTIITLLSILVIVRLRLAKSHKLFFLIALSFFLEVVMFRYYGGQRFFYFSNFAHPAVIILTAWVLVEVFKLQKIIGLILGLAIFSSALKTSFANLAPRDITLPKINSVKNEIYRQFPDENFDIYGCSFSGALVSHPLALFMYADDRNRLDGEKIGVCYLTDKTIDWHVLSSNEIADKNTWLKHSTETVYRSMTEWWKINPPK